MAERDGWEKAESVCKSFAALLVPAVLGVAGIFANSHLEGQKQALEGQKHALEAQKQTLEREKFDQQMWTKAIDVVFFSKDKEHLFGTETSLESRRLYRSHWLDTYNQFAKVKLSEAFMALVMEQDTGTSEHRIVRAAEKKKQPDEQGDGWVAVGRFPSTRAADQNFKVPASAVSDGEIQVGTTIRARWTVNLRKNYENPEERAINPVLGIIQAGECAQVLESRADVRGQTWAYVDVALCSIAMIDAKDARG